MKRSNSILAEQALKESGQLFSSNDREDSQDLLIFVTELRDLKIKLTNLLVDRFYKQAKDQFQKKKDCFYQQVIHPEDYPGFISHLRSLEGLCSGTEKEITVRMSGPSGDWKNFLFKHRLYKFNRKDNQPYAIGFAKEITGRKKGLRNSIPNHRSEKNLRRTQYNLQVLKESIKEAFCSLEPLFDATGRSRDHVVLETNAAFNRIVTLQVVPGQTIKEVYPGLEEFWFETLGKVAREKEPVQFQNYALLDFKRWFNVQAFPLDQEEPSRIAVLFSDITSKKIAEEKAKEANNLLQDQIDRRSRKLDNNVRLIQTIFENSNLGLVVLKPLYDKDGNLVDFHYLQANKVVTEKYEHSLVGCNYLETNPDEGKRGIFEAYKRVMFSGIYEDFEYKCILHNTTYWFRITARRENNLLIVSMEDISRRKREAQRLQESVRFNKQLAETSPDIILILDLIDEKVSYINRDLAAQTGMRKKHIDGMALEGIIPFIHPHDREKCLDFHSHLKKAIDRRILDTEFRLKTTGETWEWYNARGKVFIRSKEGEVCQYILLLRNIDQQKHTQQALFHAEKLSIKGEVARTLAHELRNPMASIGMAADILQKMTEKENSLAINYIEIIKRSNNILNRLVSDLLNASNYSPLKPVKCCLAETLEKALKAAADRIYLVGIKVVKNYKGKYNILADPEKLQIALLNIIINASEAMNPNEGILELNIERKSREYRLTITDNGCGIDKEQLDKLFDAFYTQKPHGVGVGLSSVKSILEEHDAKVIVESKPKKGTTFDLSFHPYKEFQRS